MILAVLEDANHPLVVIKSPFYLMVSKTTLIRVLLALDRSKQNKIR